MCAAFKASGVPPTAGIIYVVTEAYRRAVGCYPFGINLQASLQTRAFTPVLKERYLIGDWLVGPCYKVRSLGRALMAALGQGQSVRVCALCCLLRGCTFMTVGRMCMFCNIHAHTYTSYVHPQPLPHGHPKSHTSHMIARTHQARSSTSRSRIPRPSTSSSSTTSRLTPAACAKRSSPMSTASSRVAPPHTRTRTCTRTLTA